MNITLNFFEQLHEVFL